MSSHRRRTALVTVLGVSALIFGSIGAARAQQARPGVSNRRLVEMQKAQEEAARRLVEVQNVQEQARRAAEFERALVQEMRLRPTVRIGSFLDTASGTVAARALANADDLELTETQETGIRDTQRAHRRDEIRRDADIEIAELELEEMMETDDLDLDAIESHMRQVANLQVDERMANLRLDRAIRDLLSDEQIDKLEEMSPSRVLIERYRQQRNR